MALRAGAVSLGAVVCKRLNQENAEECVDIVSCKIASFISTELQQWFIENNSWVSKVTKEECTDGFVEFFDAEEPESSIRNTLLVVAGLGIGACLFRLIR